MRDLEKVLEALRAKTVANGCTPDEEAAARLKIEELSPARFVELTPAEFAAAVKAYSKAQGDLDVLRRRGARAAFKRFV